MPWFCHVYTWCSPDVFRELDIWDTERLTPLVDAYKAEARKRGRRRG